MPPYPAATLELIQVADAAREEYNQVNREYNDVNSQIQWVVLPPSAVPSLAFGLSFLSIGDKTLLCDALCVENGLLTSWPLFRDIESFLAQDMGPGDVFYPLRDQCYEYTDREYTYKFCPFSKASQRPKGGGSETSLGWVSPTLGFEMEGDLASDIYWRILNPQCIH